MHAWERSALAPQEGLALPPFGTPVSALRRARPPPSDVGRAPHTAPRAPPWAFTLHSGCSHHPHNVSAHALSSHRGIGILAQSPRRDQRAGGRRTRRTPPNTPTNRPRSWPGLPACPPLRPEHSHRQPTGVAFLPPTRPPDRTRLEPCRPRRIRLPRRWASRPGRAVAPRPRSAHRAVGLRTP